MKSEKLQGLYEGLKLAIKIIKSTTNKKHMIEIIESHIKFLGEKE